MTRNSSTLVANDEISIGTTTRRKPVVTKKQLRRSIARAETVNAILLDAGSRPQQYLETFRVEGGGE